MSVKDEYLAFRNSNPLKTNNFKDRVVLQNFLRERIDKIWDERPNFTNGGLLTNYMTQYAVGFAYYDCRPTAFCRTRCYGLPISGLHDYYMLRLGVITSESLKNGDARYLRVLKNHLEELKLKCLKIGHWGDAVLEQVPNVARIVKEAPRTIFWWYTRKIEIALAANELHLVNLRAYLSLDPNTAYPSNTEYPYGITYLFGDGQRHKNHEDILNDRRLVAVFPLKKGSSIEDPGPVLANHPNLCEEKKRLLSFGSKGQGLCLSCANRCNYSFKK